MYKGGKKKKKEQTKKGEKGSRNSFSESERGRERRPFESAHPLPRGFYSCKKRRTRGRADAALTVSAVRIYRGTFMRPKRLIARHNAAMYKRANNQREISMATTLSLLSTGDFKFFARPSIGCDREGRINEGSERRTDGRASERRRRGASSRIGLP